MIRLGIVLAVALCATSAFAQNSNSGEIRGTAADATGAVLPGVTVTVQDVDKDVITIYKTDGAGLYDTGSIVTDHYTITFTKEGFGSYVRGPVTLDVETLTINGILRVGAATETVTVTDDVPLMQTETATQGTTLAEQEMQDLPNFASWENFVILMPGTSGTPTGGESNLNPGQTASVNGNAVFYNVLGDGVTMSLPSNGNSLDYNFDSLQEVQMVTSVPSAQYENGGVIYNQISKGGTSHYHGDLFEYFQNNDLNAASYAFGQPGSVPVQRANYYGGSFGGYVPGRMFAKKLFFFFNYNRTQSYGGSSNGFETVPTTAMMNGDFTGLQVQQPDGTFVPLQIYDPTTQTVDASGTLHRLTFQQEYGTMKIPANLISPAAQNIMKSFPAANVSNPSVNNGVTTNNVFYNVPSNSPGYSYFYRADYDITPKNRLTATQLYWISHSNELSNDCPINCTTATGSAITATISDVWTLSAAKINEFHLGLSTQNNLYLPESIGQGYPAKLGIKWAKADLFPEVNFSNCGGNEPYCLGPGTNAIQHQVMFEPSDVVTMIKGKHVLHFGGEFLDQQINATLWGNVDAGATNFTGAYTKANQNDALMGLPFADFLLGDVNSWSANNTPEFYPRMKTVQLFAQDDIKLRPNITLNLGLRWEGWEGMGEAHGNERSWDPNVKNPGVDPFGNVNTPGAMWYANTAANGRTKVIAPVWNTYLPRFGVSWQMKPNTVIRGGIGLYAYNFQEGPSAYSEIGFAKGQSGNLSDNTNSIFPVLQLDQDGSVNDQGPTGSSINANYLNAPSTPDALNGQGVNFAYSHEPLSKIWQYNLEVQREIGRDMAFQLAYVGSHGFDQLFGIDLNQIPAAKLGPDDLGTTNIADDARPYPNFQSIGGNKLIAISNYNSLQTTIQKRMSSGVEFNFNYTWSKYLDETDPCAWNCGTFTVQDMTNARANYGPSDFDITSMFKGRIIYKVPFGRGQRFLNNSALLDEIIGGWQTSATIQVQTGNPFTVVTANNNSFSQSGYQYPNVVGGVSPYAGAHQIGPNLSWFNPNAFSQPDAATFGDSGRDTLRGPGLSNVNFSLGKNFTIWRESKFQLRADASNVFNHPSFGLPNTNWGPGQTSSITSLTVGGRAVELLGKINF
jgi:hypothetical protein